MTRQIPASAVGRHDLFCAGAASLESVAYRRDVLFPRTTETVRPAVCLPGQLDRVTGTLPQFDLAAVLRSAQATSMTLSPTVAYYLRDAVVFDGSVYAGAYRHYVAEPALFPAGSRTGPHFRQRAFVSSYMGTKYFGHWLRDDCVQYELAGEIAMPLCLSRPEYRDQVSYSEYFGQNWMATDRASVEEIVVFQDYAQNSHKRERSRALRGRLRARFAANTTTAHNVYLRRGSTGAPRRIANEDDIISALMRQGFQVADVETDPLPRILGLLLSARLVVSIEGSQLAHCALTCPDDAGLLVLQPSDRFSLNHREWAAPLGLNFGFVVGSRDVGGYRFSVPEILRTAELLLDSS